MKTTDTGHLLGKKNAQRIADHLYDVGEDTKEAAIMYVTEGEQLPALDEMTKMLIDEGLKGNLPYLIKCASELNKVMNKILEKLED